MVHILDPFRNLRILPPGRCRKSSRFRKRSTETKWNQSTFIEMQGMVMKSSGIILSIIFKNTLVISFFGGMSTVVVAGALSSSGDVGTESIAPTVQYIEKMSCRDCHKMFLKREKFLKSVKSLLDIYAPVLANGMEKKSENDVNDLKEIKFEEGKRVDKKIAALTKLYKKQYAKLSRQIPQIQAKEKKIQSIVGEMRVLLDQLDQKELSYVVKYQKALHCHELFGALERMLTKDGSLQDMSYDPLAVREGESRSEVMTSIAGLPEQDPRKKVRKPRPDEIQNYDPSLVVPASVGIKHGFDRLLDVDRIEK